MSVNIVHSVSVNIFILFSEHSYGASIRVLEAKLSLQNTCKRSILMKCRFISISYSDAPCSRWNLKRLVYFPRGDVISGDLVQLIRILPCQKMNNHLDDSELSYGIGVGHIRIYTVYVHVPVYAFFTLHTLMSMPCDFTKTLTVADRAVLIQSLPECNRRVLILWTQQCA